MVSEETTSGGKITISGTEPAPGLMGWVCPVSRGGVSQLQLRCPCVPIPTTPVPWQLPQTPYWWPQDTHRVPDQPLFTFTCDTNQKSLVVNGEPIVALNSASQPFYCNTAETDMRDKAIGYRSSYGDWR